MSEIDGVVSIKEDNAEVLITVTSKGSKSRLFDVTGAALAKGIKDKSKVEEGQVLFMDVEGEEVTAEFAGSIHMDGTQLKLTGRGKDVREYVISLNTTLSVKDGDEIMAGQQLTEGHLNVQNLFEIAGVRAVQQYILREVQQVYAIQGETINDKHLEIIVRQMLGRVRIHESGDTILLAGRVVELAEYLMANREAEAEGKKLAVGERLLLGITKVSLTTRSFLAAASFMETARVMIDAAVTGRADGLEGLKENVIIGRLIPVGTGYEGSLAAEEAEEAMRNRVDDPVELS